MALPPRRVGGVRGPNGTTLDDLAVKLDSLALALAPLASLTTMAADIAIIKNYLSPAPLPVRINGTSYTSTIANILRGNLGPGPGREGTGGNDIGSSAYITQQQILTLYNMLTKQFSGLSQPELQAQPYGLVGLLYRISAGLHLAPEDYSTSQLTELLTRLGSNSGDPDKTVIALLDAIKACSCGDVTPPYVPVDSCAAGESYAVVTPTYVPDALLNSYNDGHTYWQLDGLEGLGWSRQLDTNNNPSWILPSAVGLCVAWDWTGVEQPVGLAEGRDVVAGNWANLSNIRFNTPGTGSHTYALENTNAAGDDLYHSLALIMSGNGSGPPAAGRLFVHTTPLA